MNVSEAVGRLRKSISEVRDFYAGKGGTMKFHIPDGKGHSIVRELTLEEYVALATAPSPSKQGERT
jgi:hypothetical protein